ncbi:MAG TPA: zinc-binding alcohol dehydrogenase family protein [Burkholderiales bacterium]|nr:zinc-binding alcohol dehydrogenase family protein [Burkholderiales bacterium]
MKAVLAREPLPAGNPRSLVDEEIPPPPAPAGHDLLVRVRAVSVNPLDTKVRGDRYHGAARGEARILGWDAAGVVEAVGEQVTAYKAGDYVYYAGSILRPGSNAELQLVDERITGSKPGSLDFAQAAALPLTTITAYEALVDRLRAREGDTVLVIGAAGGVGSMAIQIGRTLGLKVVATASRPESARWCRELGAAHVIDHSQPLREGLRGLGIAHADCVLNCADLDRYWLDMAEAVRPQGSLCSVVANAAPVDLKAIQRKCATFAFEAMFSRSSLGLPDMVEQQRLLNRVAGWIDAGTVRSTMTEHLAPINAANLRKAHERLESRRMIGKIVLSGW